jgi:hypothetical protein
MPQDGDGQEPREESPTSQPEQSPVAQSTQPVDTGTETDQNHAPAPSTPSEDAAPQGDRPRDDAGRFAPKSDKPAAPDPVKAAIDKLSRPDPASTDAPKPSGKTAAVPTKQQGQPAVEPTDKALKTRIHDDLDAPPELRAQMKKDTAERFDRVLTAARTARAELEQIAPYVERGKEYVGVIKEFELDQDLGFVPKEHFAGVVKAQAAVNRSLLALQQGRAPLPQDLETVTHLGLSVDAIRSQLGVTTGPAPSAAVTPFTGELPADLRDLVDVYGVDEKTVRKLAAIQAAEAGTPPAQPPPRVAAPAQPQQQPAPQPPRQPSADQVRERTYTQKFLTELTTEGVISPQQHLRELLSSPQTRQEVITRFPGINVADIPVVFDSLEPSLRYEILKAAHKALTGTSVPARSATPPPPTTQRGVPVTAATRGKAAPSGKDAVEHAIGVLSR